MFLEAKSTDEVTRVRNDARPGVRLPKFEGVKFSGDPIEWKSFSETFKTAICKQ